MRAREVGGVNFYEKSHKPHTWRFSWISLFFGWRGGTQVTRYGLMVAKHKIFFVIVMQINLWEIFSCEVVPLWSFAKSGGIPHLGEDFMDGWQN